jgi:hypothetical protein
VVEVTPVPEDDDAADRLRQYHSMGNEESSSSGGSGGFSVPQWLLVVIVSVVTVAWAGSLILDAFVKSYDPPATISLAFMAVVSALLGSGVVRSLPSRKKGRDDDQ